MFLEKCLRDAQQRLFAIVEAEVIGVVKNPRIIQVAQLGIDVAATQRDAGAWGALPNAPRDAQRAIERAGKGDRQTHQRRFVLGQRLIGQVIQQAIQQRWPPFQRPLQ